MSRCWTMCITLSFTLSVLGAPAAAGPLYSSTILDHNPIAYYRLNEAAGNTAFDQLGSNHGAYGAALTLGQSGPAAPAYAGFESTNTAVQFDKSDFGSVLKLPTALGMTSQRGAVSMWFNVTAEQASDQNPVRNSFLFYASADAFGDGYGSAREHHLHVKSDGTLEFFSRRSGTDPFLVGTDASQGNFVDGKWHHVVFSWNRAATADIYVDGAHLVSVADSGDLFAFSRAIQFGRPESNNERGERRRFGGQIDEVALFNRALTPTEVQEQYRAATIPEPSSLALLAVTALGTAGCRRRGRTFA